MVISVFFFFLIFLIFSIFSLLHFLDMQLIAQPGIGHEMTPLMVKEASDWLDRFLKQ
jgi:hypothetical protein